MSLRAHKILSLVALAVGFFGGAAVVLIINSKPSIWALVAAVGGMSLMKLIFWLIVPAYCPQCSKRMKIKLRRTSQLDPSHSGHTTVEKWEYTCKECDFSG